jgi:hypothetical protein
MPFSQVTIKITVLWDVILCNRYVKYRRFVRTFCPHILRCPSTLKTSARCSDPISTCLPRHITSHPRIIIVLWDVMLCSRYVKHRRFVWTFCFHVLRYPSAWKTSSAGSSDTSAFVYLATLRHIPELLITCDKADRTGASRFIFALLPYFFELIYLPAVCLSVLPSFPFLPSFLPSFLLFRDLCTAVDVILNASALCKGDCGTFHALGMYVYDNNVAPKSFCL